MGKSIEFQHKKHYIVSGFSKCATNSSLQFDFIKSFEVFRERNPGIAKWENSSPNTYVVLKEGADPNAFQQKIEGLLKTKTSDTHRTLIVTKYSDGYLHALQRFLLLGVP